MGICVYETKSFTITTSNLSGKLKYIWIDKIVFWRKNGLNFKRVFFTWTVSMWRHSSFRCGCRTQRLEKTKMTSGVMLVFLSFSNTESLITLLTWNVRKLTMYFRKLFKSGVMWVFWDSGRFMRARLTSWSFLHLEVRNLCCGSIIHYTMCCHQVHLSCLLTDVANYWLSFILKSSWRPQCFWWKRWCTSPCFLPWTWHSRRCTFWWGRNLE